MLESRFFWKGRRKRRSRKVANDFRLAAPLLFLTFCFAGSATAIAAVEWAPEHIPFGADKAPQLGAPFAGAFAASPSER